MDNDNTYMDDEQIEELIKEAAEKCGVDERNIYYNMVKAKMEKSYECIQSSGATNVHGKPSGFRRIG